MKIVVRVRGRQGVIVGYCPGKKNRPLAIVLTEGKLVAVRLKELQLSSDEKVTDLPRKREAA